MNIRSSTSSANLFLLAINTKAYSKLESTISNSMITTFELNIILIEVQTATIVKAPKIYTKIFLKKSLLYIPFITSLLY